MVSANTKPGTRLWMLHGMNPPQQVAVLSGSQPGDVGLLVRPVDGGNSKVVPAVDLFTDRKKAVVQQACIIEAAIVKLQKRLAAVKKQESHES